MLPVSQQSREQVREWRLGTIVYLFGYLSVLLRNSKNVVMT